MNEENPYAAPQADLDSVDYEPEGDGEVVRHGKTLMLWEDSHPPHRCVACNRPAAEKFVVRTMRRKTAWLSTLLLVAFVFGMLMLGMVLIEDLLDFSRLAAACFHTGVMLSGLLMASILSRLVRPRDQIGFEFHICSLHKRLRRFWLGSSWAIGAIFFSMPVVRELWPDEEYSIFFMLGIYFIFIPVQLVLWKIGVAVGAQPNQFSPYVFKGFGKKFLESFPDADETPAGSDET
ncbi:hypothetical protein [Aeoliella mucimassa]|uniref:Uncharacterized protein n=1 Tax=Aeoliella mucimassa TaxID=2527972 RepID=A0A518AKC0_9BACT|nr:hypothetical protein [Aeoliella mucimassa]QDU55188.1 hypothetical protein Pan181_13740 [Aeoliella mucimassa]